MVADALGMAMRDYQRDQLGECRYVDGDETQDGNIREHYFTPREEWDQASIDRYGTLPDPILDVGCGAGQHLCFFQDRGKEAVGIDVSPGAVQAAQERGAEDARVGDMFELRSDFDRDAFRTVQMNGTQLGLAHSFAGVQSLLSDLAYITDEDGIAVVDNYDAREVDKELFGYRSDPRDGVAHRTFHFEYEPLEGERIQGRALHFLLFSPDRLRDVCVGTPWSVSEVHHRGVYYQAHLEK